MAETNPIDDPAVPRLRGDTAASAPTRLRLRNVIGNIALAAVFLAVLTPGAQSHWGSGAANRIWFFGSILVGLLILVRRPTINYDAGWQSLVSNAGAMITPLLMRTGAPIGGWPGRVAVVIELAGVIMAQSARIWMGRRFGVLPANRGVIAGGPFRFVRHPIYLGWLMLGWGYALCYPRWSNLVLMTITILLTIWRINLEEDLLARDPGYRAYRLRVRARLIPGIY
ncbi:MAG: methyltransferase family protein [Candidatus Binataceae bacterium]